MKRVKLFLFTWLCLIAFGVNVGATNRIIDGNTLPEFIRTKKEIQDKWDSSGKLNYAEGIWVEDPIMNILIKREL